MQYVRELTQNSMRPLERKVDLVKFSGHLIERLKKHRNRKLCILDNGAGMDGKTFEIL